MAYANLVGTACANKTEFFCRMRDFICKRNGTYDYSATGIGWTLHDSSYATNEDNPAVNDWYVIYSPGEGGKDDLYMKITMIAANIYINGYQAWDATAHTGGNRYVTSTTNFNVAATDVPTLYVYGDLDGILCAKYLSGGTDLRQISFGSSNPPWDYTKGTIATCSSALTSGSDVSITVDAAPAEWAVGREIFIRTTHNNATATVKIEKTTIKTLVGNTITVDLTNSYTTGSCLSDHVGYFCGNSYVLGTTNFLIDAKGIIGTGTGSITFDSGIAGGSNDPGSYESMYGLAEAGLNGANGLVGWMKNIRRINYTGLSLFDVLAENDGTQWRYLKFYSVIYTVVKEV